MLVGCNTEVQSATERVTVVVALDLSPASYWKTGIPIGCFIWSSRRSESDPAEPNL